MGSIKKYTLKNFFVFLGLMALSISIAASGLYYFSASIYDTKLKELKTKIELNSKSIEILTGSLEQKATELAEFGSTMHSLSHKYTKNELDELFSLYLTNSFSDFNNAIGGGVWFEPFALLNGEKYYGPYAFREKNKIKFTWDLSTPKYNYHGWDWYEMALPKNHNRAVKREKKYYWSAPYQDGAGSGALMITVDAFVYDKDKKIVGISTVDWALDDMLSYIEKSRPTAKTHSFLIDNASSLVLLNTLNPSSRMKKFGEDAHLKSILTDKKESIIAINGIKYQLLIVQTSNKMSYGILTPTSELAGEQNRFIVIGILVAIGLTAFFYIIYINITTRLKQIIEDKTEALLVSLENVRQREQKISILLNNAGQGFLTFGNNLKIDREYSKECIKLLGDDLAGKEISQILSSDEKKREFFANAAKLAINETNKMKINSYISLLPQTVVLNKKAIKLEYKILENKNMMMILTNITSQKQLENRVKKEQETLKMTVAIISDSHIFYDSIKEYAEFFENIEKHTQNTQTPQENLDSIYRIVHTFKGTFSQLFIQNIVEFLHEVESTLSDLMLEDALTNEKIAKTLKAFDFKTNFEASLQMIKEILGDDFINSQKFVKIELSDIESLQNKIAKILDSHDEVTPECTDILCQVKGFSHLKLYELLKPYSKFSYELAKRLGKEIAPFEVEGDKDLGISIQYKPFIKSLVHIFRNMIDHGIEEPETRLQKGKNECGNIFCKFEKDAIQLKITIGDDGAGVDIQKLKIRLEEMGIDTSQLSHNEIVRYIFIQNVTTKDEASQISGRGVGMSVAKEELDKIGGDFEITTAKDIGTTIEFRINI